MIGFFRERHTLQVPLFFALALASRAVFLSHPPYLPEANTGGLLPPLLHRFVSATTPGISLSFSFMVLVFSSLLANYYLGASRMFARNNMLVAISVLLTASLLPMSAALSAAICMVPLQILLFGLTVRLYNQSQPRTTIINMGLLAGLGTLLYHPFVWMVPACFIGLTGMRAFRLNEWLLLGAALLTPHYFVLSYEYVFESRQFQRHIPQFGLALPPALNTTQIMVLIVAALWLLAGAASLHVQLRRMVIQSRKYWYYLIFTGLVLLPGIFLSGSNMAGILILLLFPFSGLAANAFVSQEASVPQILLFWIIVVAIGSTQWAFVTGRW